MPFTIGELEQARNELGGLVRTTPTWQWLGEAKDRYVGNDTQVAIKLELFQYAGSFKSRGALCVMLEMTDTEREQGVTAISAGNHAIAVSYAAKVIGTHAKVVMPASAPQSRIDTCVSMGTEVEVVDDVMVAFERVKQIEREEKRKFVHPFDGPGTILGTGTCGLEFYQQVEHLDAAIIPIGGGGLAAGMSAAIKLCNPDCRIFGVEPTGANSMYRSFGSGKPEKIESVDTIAKSLGAPFALPYSFEICHKNIERVVLVSDDEMLKSMAIMFHDLKLVTEPAAAASMAALIGPLRKEVAGERVGIIACGSNIDRHTFCDFMKIGEGNSQP